MTFNTLIGKWEHPAKVDKSARTDDRNSVLKCIIGPYSLPYAHLPTSISYILCLVQFLIVDICIKRCG